MTGLITGVDQFTSDQSRKTDLEQDGKNGYLPHFGDSPRCSIASVLGFSILRSYYHNEQNRRGGTRVLATLWYPSARIGLWELLLLSLASCRFPRGRVQWQASTHSSSQRGMDTVQRILTFLTRLTRLCLRSLNDHFVAWTTSDSTSFLLWTLTDLSRSKSELVAENALLRQQLIMLRRQVKRPACTKTDRMVLVLLAHGLHNECEKEPVCGL
jgi:hypothetical protein